MRITKISKFEKHTAKMSQKISKYFFKEHSTWNSQLPHV